MKKEKTVGVFGAESVDTEPEQKENPMKQEPEKTESKQIEKQKRKKDKLWIAIAAAVALIAANVLLFVIIVQHGGKTAVSAVETAEAAEIDDSASEAEASPNAEATAYNRLLLAETTQLIYEAGDGGYEENAFYSKEIYDSYWEEIKKEWINECRDIIDYYGERYADDTRVKGFFRSDLSAEDIAANDGLKIAFGMVLLRFGEMHDGRLFDGIKIWDLVDNYPTIEDFYAVTYKTYEGNVDALFEDRRVDPSYEPSAHDRANTSFVNRWIGESLSDEPEVVFRNPAIELNFREKYGISGTICLSNVLCITHLNFNMYVDGISDISDVAMFSNLTHLCLAHTQVDDISVLSSLKNLTKLDLSRTDVADLSALSGLTKLTFLSLDKTQISDISALSGLTGLVTLSLGDTQISDISALSGLAYLVEIHLGNTQISDISALSGLTNLEYLFLGGTQIRDVSALAGLNNLRILDLRNTKVTREQISALQLKIPECDIWY